MIRVGVDVGGTFTDIVLERSGNGAEQQVVVTKVSSTPHDQSEGVVEGILKVAALAGVEPGEIDAVFHGTTVATNMVIERAGAKVGMVTTRGFRDILHMARHKRPHNFSLQFDLPWQSKPLVRRRDRLAVTERIMPPTGTVEVPLAEDEVKQAAELFARRGMDAVIVAFLFSFLNNEHEQRAKEIVKSVLPDAFVSASSDVVNTIREYERFSSAAMNAYIGPKTSAYLTNLEGRLRANGIKAMVRIMQSNGGISTIENSSELPTGLLLSGPAGGVIGGRWTGEHSGKNNVITIDIGGTSADISVIEDGELRIKNPRDTEVAGLPVLVPMIDIDAIGAGGGSIAYLDPGGAFRVGPRSAGAVPGPACYAKGGEEPTVTDAQVVLGRMDPEHFLGGDLKIDASLSEKAIRKHIAEPLKLTVEQAALGILKIINNNMALAINANSVAKGVDPRNFSLMGFGGAGPLHSVSLAEAIHAKDVISPVHPGITAATGLLVTDLQYEYTHSTLMVLDNASDEEFARVNAVLDELVGRANRQLDADGIPEKQRVFRQVAECRYVGQGFELRAEVPSGRLGKESAAAVIDNFYNAHKQVYGHAFRDQQTEMVTLRVIATVAVDTLKLPKLAKGGRQNPAEAELYRRRTVFDNGEALETPRYQRGKLLADDTIAGPALVIQHNSTTIVPPGYVATVLEYGDMRIERKGRPADRAERVSGIVKEVDPITLQVIGGALHSIAEQMGNVLYRMSYSSIIRESQDLGAGLFDMDYNTLCESDSTPMHIGSLPGYLRGIEKTVPLDAWKPGDCVVHNHPYYGASHSPDIGIVMPIFFEGELVGFSANTAHHVDIGAATPGLVIDIPDVFAEGMLLNGLKLYNEGVRNEPLWKFIRDNTRVPSLVMGDLEAQIAAAELGVLRFQQLMTTYGKDTVLQSTRQLMDYTENMLRREIEKIPDGDYVAEGFLDDDGRNRGVNLPLKVTVKVRGDGVEVDTTGSSAQVPTAFNVPFDGSTKVACYFAFRALLLDTYTHEEYIPQNEGSFRPVKVTSPLGSIFNPISPVAAEARFSQIQRLCDLIIKALAPVLPDKCTAGNAAVLSFAAYSGVRPSGDYWVFLEVNEAAMGGRPQSDGPDTVEELMRNTRNNPLEDLGMHLPLICDRYEVRDDVPPGAGKFRGGAGVVKSQRYLTPGFMTHESDRNEDAPWGIFGGKPGHGSKVELRNDMSGKLEYQPAKFSGLRTEIGDVITYYSPTGGGYGDPLERDPAKVLDDVLDGFITVDHARDDYGVVLADVDDGYGWALDPQATTGLRAEMARG